MNSYQNALNTLNEFKSNPSTELLRTAADFLLEHLKVNKKHASSYYCLAYIFYALDNTRFAMQFIKIAEKICPEPPVELNKFKNIVLNEGAIYKSYELDTRKEVSFDMSRKPLASSASLRTSVISRPESVKARVSENSNFLRLQRERSTVANLGVKSSRPEVSANRPIDKTITTNEVRSRVSNISSLNIRRPEAVKAKLSDKSSFWNVLKK